jgi:hypothetical protein
MMTEDENDRIPGLRERFLDEGAIQEEPGAKGRIQVDTIFLVYTDELGRFVATSDLRWVERLEARRPATLADMHRAGQEISKDVLVSQISEVIRSLADDQESEESTGEPERLS